MMGYPGPLLWLTAALASTQNGMKATPAGLATSLQPITFTTFFSPVPATSVSNSVAFIQTSYFEMSTTNYTETQYPFYKTKHKKFEVRFFGLRPCELLNPLHWQQQMQRLPRHFVEIGVAEIEILRLLIQRVDHDSCRPNRRGSSKASRSNALPTPLPCAFTSTASRARVITGIGSGRPFAKVPGAASFSNPPVQIA